LGPFFLSQKDRRRRLIVIILSERDYSNTYLLKIAQEMSKLWKLQALIKFE
jgi:hypothetical protein